jgi:phage terminase large subunit
MKTLKIDYKPRGWQKEVIKDLNRFTVLVLHRRAGKTVFDVMQSIVAVLKCKLPRPQAAYIAPTYSMAKKIAWDYYREFLEPMRRAGLVTFNESALRIDFQSGGKIYLLGAEEPDAIRGMYMDHVVLDEYQMMQADFFEKVIRPLLSDRNGRAILTGTPSGKNHFHEAYQKGLDETFTEWSSVLMTWQDTLVLAEKEIEAAKRDMSEEAFLQEYECSFEAAIRGAFFAKNIAKVRVQGRLKDIRHDPSYPVVAGWDIGFDGTTVWYSQKIGEEVRIIDCDVYEDKDIPYVVNKVLNKGYTYKYQILPHDSVKRMITDKRKTAKGQIENLGLQCKVAPRLSLEDGIHATRNLIDRSIFGLECEKKFKLGRTQTNALDLLTLYRAEFDETKGVANTTPVHDRSSHVADALRTLAVGIKNSSVFEDKVVPGVIKENTGPMVDNKWNPFKRR